MDILNCMEAKFVVKRRNPESLLIEYFMFEQNEWGSLEEATIFDAKYMADDCKLRLHRNGIKCSVKRIDKPR